MGVAMRRAAHQRIDDPVVFRDPLAERIVGGGGVHLYRAGSRWLRAFVAARSRFAEDELATFHARGIGQYVILGAGLDTFAYRNPYSSSLQVFEVDYPATQAWKIERLHEAGIAIPESAKFVPVDFETQELAPSLKSAPKFDSASSFFSMLGVTPYLTREALVATLRAIALMGTGSGVVFDYALPAASFGRLSARVAKLGEAFRLFLEPQEISALLSELGFTVIENLGRQEINARYFEGRSDGLRIDGVTGRMLSARVGQGTRRRRHARRVEMNDAALEGDRDGVGAILGAQFAEDTLHVGFHGAWRGSQHVAYFFVAHAARH